MLGKINTVISIIKINMMKGVVYSSNVEATKKITSEWYLWMHHTIDKIPDNYEKKNLNGKKIILKIKQVHQKVLSQ